MAEEEGHDYFRFIEFFILFFFLFRRQLGVSSSISLRSPNREVLSAECSLVKDVKGRRGEERGISGRFLRETQFCITPLKPESLQQAFQGLQRFAAEKRRGERSSSP